MLGFAEFCIPGDTLEKKLEALERHKLWLEMACRGKRDISAIESFCIEVKSVQAYLLHDLSILSKDRTTKVSAINHIKDSIRLASEVGAKYVLTVPAYGFEYVSSPFKKCVSTFKTLSKFASDYGVTILIEPLSIKRTSFLPSINEVSGLVKKINRENVRLMADACHIYDSGKDVTKTVKEFKDEIVELHLKDSDSKPPGKGILNFNEIIKACKGTMFCVEYSDNRTEYFEETLNYLLYKNIL